MSFKWLPLGDFDSSDDTILFKGKIVEVQKPDAPVEFQASVGRAISDQRCYGGKISVDVTFEYQVTAAATSYPITAEIAFFEPGSPEHMLVAGIGGNFALFGIREWDRREGVDGHQKGWQPPLIQGGWIGQLKAGQPYSLCVQVEPSRLILLVDDIHVASALIKFPVVGSYIGIFCQSPENIVLKNFNIEQQRPMVFVAMPFSDPYNDLYSHVFQPVCEKCELSIYRSDKTYQTGIIIAEIVDKIVSSHIIVAEITPNPANPNVYYEVGFAHAMGKPVILVADRNCSNKLPFDISPFKVLFYENTIAGRENILRDLVGYLESVLPHYDPISTYQRHITKNTRIG